MCSKIIIIIIFLNKKIRHLVEIMVPFYEYRHLFLSDMALLIPLSFMMDMN